MKNFFIFNGKDSRDFDIQLGEYPPIVKPRERIEPVTVPGRSGTLHLKEGEYIYDSYVKPFNIVALDESRIDEIKDWLQGSGELIIGNELDWIYDAYIFEQLEFTRFFRGWHRASLNIEVQSFKKSKNVIKKELEWLVDNVVTSNSDLPLPFKINLYEPQGAVFTLLINGLKWRTAISGGMEPLGTPYFVCFDGGKGEVSYIYDDDPENKQLIATKSFAEKLPLYLNKGENIVTLASPSRGGLKAEIEYRELNL